MELYKGLPLRTIDMKTFIEYKGIKYQTRELIVNIGGEPRNILVAPLILSENMGDNNTLETETIDNKVYFYANEGFISKTDSQIALEDLDEAFELWGDI